MEIPLVTGLHELRTVSVRLDCAGRSIYNACLGRAFKSGRRLQESHAFRKIREINREIRLLLKKRRPEDLPPQERLRLETLRQARTTEERERAILSIRVLDPACGSGHFLLAAARRLGLELARIRTGEEEPSPEARREATRDVIAHCIYAVDKNPLAVELCKVALWIESRVPGKPLTFLDHRVRCGDSLLGILDLEDLVRGVPDAAYERPEREAQRTPREPKHRNRSDKARQALFAFSAQEWLTRLARSWQQIAALPEENPQDLKLKQARYQALLPGPAGKSPANNLRPLGHPPGRKSAPADHSLGCPRG